MNRHAQAMRHWHAIKAHRHAMAARRVWVSHAGVEL